jgi:hypothetical protein
MKSPIKYAFCCYGHQNIQGTHKNTFEFTKDKEVSLDGNCIIGVNADFDVDKLKSLLKSKQIKMTLKAGTHKDEVLFFPNPDFSDLHEIVVRLGEFISSRTLGVRADKASIHINRKLIELMKKPDQKLEILLESQE